MSQYNPPHEELEKELLSDLGEPLFADLIKLVQQDRKFREMLVANAGKGFEEWDPKEDSKQLAKIHRLLPATERVLKRWLCDEDFSTVRALFEKARVRCDAECEEFLWKPNPGRRLRPYVKLEIKFMDILKKNGLDQIKAARCTEKLLKLAGYNDAKASSITVRRSKS